MKNVAKIIFSVALLLSIPAANAYSTNDFVNAIENNTDLAELLVNLAEGTPNIAPTLIEAEVLPEVVEMVATPVVEAAIDAIPTAVEAVSTAVAESASVVENVAPAAVEVAIEAAPVATGMLARLKAQALTAQSTIANGLASAWTKVANSAAATKAHEWTLSGKQSLASFADSVKGGSSSSINALNNGFNAVKTFAIENPYKTTAIAAGVVVTTVAAYKLISNYFAKKNTDNAQAA